MSEAGQAVSMDVVARSTWKTWKQSPLFESARAMGAKSPPALLHPHVMKQILLGVAGVGAEIADG